MGKAPGRGPGGFHALSNLPLWMERFSYAAGLIQFQTLAVRAAEQDPACAAGEAGRAGRDSVCLKHDTAGKQLPVRLREICDSQGDMIHTAVGPAGGGWLFDQLQHAGPVLQERNRRSLVFIPEDLHKVQHILLKADRPLQIAHIDADMRQIQIH